MTATLNGEVTFTPVRGSDGVLYDVPSNLIVHSDATPPYAEGPSTGDVFTINGTHFNQVNQAAGQIALYGVGSDS